MFFARNDQNISGAFHESPRTCDCVKTMLCGFDAEFAIKKKKIKTSHTYDKRTPERFAKEFNVKFMRSMRKVEVTCFTHVLQSDFIFMQAKNHGVSRQSWN